jgi:uncharacterized protein YbaR (Trm112 family)
MALDEKLLAILACPQDHGPLYPIADEDLLFNPRLQRAYRIVDDIPVMLIDEAITLDEAESQRLSDRVAAESIPPTFSD